MIFLPPYYHFLMRLTVEENSIVFQIATDLWSLLPYINEWINTIV